MSYKDFIYWPLMILISPLLFLVYLFFIPSEIREFKAKRKLKPFLTKEEIDRLWADNVRAKGVQLTEAKALRVLEEKYQQKLSSKQQREFDEEFNKLLEEVIKTPNK